MKKVYDFGRNQLGLKFEFNFYLGDFEEAVFRAYPTNKWIPTRTPSYGVGGRGHTLSQSDPLCKELCQKFWKSFIDTFGTDHRYWVAYREESRHENNPKDPDYGFSQADAVKKAKEWITEIDPKAEIYHWDWHFLPTYVDADIYKKIKKAKKAEEYPHKEIKKSFKEYFKQIPEDITIMNVLTPGLYSLPPLMYPYNIVDITDHYDGKHPWVIGSLMGYAQQDIGYGGLFVSTKKMFSLWRKWVKEDPDMGNKLRGVFHYNELVQVNPLLSQMISEFAWSGILPDSLDSINTNEPMLDNYFSLRFGKKDAPFLRKCNAEIFGDDVNNKAEKEENFRLAPESVLPSIRIPILVGHSSITAKQKRKRKKILNGLKKLVSVRGSQQNNPLYANEVVDSARFSLHYLGRMWLMEAIDIAKNQKKYSDAQKRFDRKIWKVKSAMITLAEILKTDPRHSLALSVQETLSEPGGNPLLFNIILEHSSSRIFENYQHTDSYEFIKYITLPLLDVYTKNLKRSLMDHNCFRFKNLSFHPFLWDIQDEMLKLTPESFKYNEDNRNPADILADWLTSIKPQQEKSK